MTRWLLLVALSLPAYAVNEHDAINEKYQSYIYCMRDAAHLYSRSSENINVLVDAAQSRCSGEFSSYASLIRQSYAAQVDHDLRYEAAFKAERRIAESKERTKGHVARIITDYRLLNSQK